MEEAIPKQEANPIRPQPGLGTQPCYEAPGDLRVKIVKNAVINIG